MTGTGRIILCCNITHLLYILYIVYVPLKSTTFIFTTTLAAKFWATLALMTFELGHGASVFAVSSEGPPKFSCLLLQSRGPEDQTINLTQIPIGLDVVIDKMSVRIQKLSVGIEN